MSKSLGSDLDKCESWFSSDRLPRVGGSFLKESPMPVSILSADGRLTVPKEIRQAVKATPGTEFLWVLMRSGMLQVVPKTGTIEDLAGMVKPAPGVSVSVEEMNPFR